MQDNSGISNRRLINPIDNNSSDNGGPGMFGNNNVANTNRFDAANDDEDKAKSRKRCMFIVGGVGAVVVIVAIILAATLGKKKDPDNPPGPPPGPPPVPPITPGFNPYKVEESSIVVENSKESGILVAKSGYFQKVPKGLNETEILELSYKLRDEPVELPYAMDDAQIPLGANNEMTQELYFEFGQVEASTIYMLLHDNKEERWEPPKDIVGYAENDPNQRLAMSKFKLNNDPFSFSIGSTFSDQTLITTENQACYLLDKYLQVDFALPSQNIFGFGERQREFKLSAGTWTMWANGQETPYDDGKGFKQTYGVHPFALVQATDKPDQFMGIWFRNTNAMSPIITHKEDGSSILSYITTGGKIHAYFFMQGAAKDIIQRYQNIAGKPRLPPFWAMGWHSSSYRYKTFDEVKANVEAYDTNKIPLDGVWFDIPYMENYADFSVDTSSTFKFDKTEAAKWQTANKKLIPIIDAGIAYTQESTYVSKAQTKQCLINEQNSNMPLQQLVWPESSVFLDFFNTDSKDIWAEGINDLYKEMPFDGLWLDMNEVTGFCNGNRSDSGKQCTSRKSAFEKTEEEVKENYINFLQAEHVSEDYQNFKRHQVKSDTNTSWFTSYKDNMTDPSTYFLPFIPSLMYNFDNMTMSLNATHPQSGYTQYDTHSLFGHMECKATWEILKEGADQLAPFKDKRQFLLSRSTFSGSGQYTSHWTGDNHRTWDDMRWSIAGIMNFNMFGIPHVGADVCGFFANVGTSDAENKEICGRWMQLATFYPFARQHSNEVGGEPNEPYNLGDKYMPMAIAAIKDRYKYLMFMYGCLAKLEQNGGTCFDPLFFHYPDLNQTYSDIESTFLVGDAIKVSPVLTAEGTETHFEVFFPQGNWVSMADYSTLVVNESKMMVMDFPDTTVHAHLRPGYIVPVQDNTDVMTAADLDTKDFSLVVNRDSEGKAQGSVYGDDGSNNMASAQEWLSISLTKGNMQVFKEDAGLPDSKKKMKEIVIGDAKDLLDIDFACYMSLDAAAPGITQLTFKADADKNTITLTPPASISLNTAQFFSFGHEATDVNLCKEGAASYTVTDAAKIDLSKSTATAQLASTNPTVYPNLKLDLAILGSGALNLHWTYEDPSGKRPIFEVPDDIVNVTWNDTGNADPKKLSDYVTLGASASAPLVTVMKDTTVIYELDSVLLVDYLNIINGKVHTYVDAQEEGSFKGIMGLAERIVYDLFLPDGIYSLWTRDTASPTEDGKLPGKNMYGVHPFYMGKATDKKWFGVFTNLAAASDWWLTNDASTGQVTLKTWAAGGLGDVYFLFGDNPDAVTQMYHSAIVGNPVLTPQWALGWNQCKWGYKNTTMLEWSVGNYSEAGIPLDGQWVDIDYLDTYKDFTVDPTNFANLSSFVDGLHSKNMKFVPIMDAGVAVADDYPAYTEGRDGNLFIKAGSDNKTDFVGSVWPGDAVYPDFTQAATVTWWQKHLSEFYSMVKFDGIWEDMNEASNFCTGACYPEQKAADSAISKALYVPTGRDLNIKSIDVDAYHANNFTELDMHSLFGTMEVKATHEWFQQQGRRTMIIERSAYAGMGKFGSRWLGDNASNEYLMGASVTGIMMHNIVGIPLAGSDICGFMGNTTAELCARWHIVGAFYPFSRNHNSWDTIPQEPWAFKNDFYNSSTTYMDIMRRGVQVKYHMTRYYYTQLSLMSQGEVAALYKPLFFEFPDEVGAYADQSSNIMLGKSLKLSVLSSKVGEDTHDFYFGAGYWCDVFNVHLGVADSCFSANAGGTAGVTKTLSTKAYEFHLHLRGGHIVPMQNATALGAMTTADLQAQPVELHIAGEPYGDELSSWQASGVYLNDDGETLDIATKQNKYIMAFDWNQNVATIDFTQVTTADYPKDDTHPCAGCVNMNDQLGLVQIYNAHNKNMDQQFSVTVTKIDKSTVTLTANYDLTSDRLIVDFAASGIYLPELATIQLTK